MKKSVRIFLLSVLATVVILSISRQDLIFSSKPDSFRIDPGKITEASGITSSSTFPNHLWVHEDSRRSATLTLLTNQGKTEAEIQLPFPNRDWEDIARGSGPISGAPYIYLADIGDNEIKYSSKFIYRFLEPKSTDEKILKFDKIEFVLEGENRDCETIIFDPITSNIYIISKWEKPVKLYELTFPFERNVNVAKQLADLPITKVTSAAVSADGTEILIRTYDSVYYVKRAATESIPKALQNTQFVNFQVQKEPQGEAICFDKNDKGFFTLSEKGTSDQVSLNYYKRLTK